jgi:hypothetical protein
MTSWLCGSKGKHNNIMEVSDIESKGDKQGIICEYCNNKFNTNSILIKHQRVAKYCLVLQGKLDDPLVNLNYENEEKEKERKKKEKEEKDNQKRMKREKREKEEQDRIDFKNKEKEEERNRKIKEEDDRRREKEKKREIKFMCEYCKVKFTTRINYCGHLDICIVKYKKILEEKEKIIEAYGYTNYFNNSCPSDENNIIKEPTPIITAKSSTCMSALTDVKQTKEVLSTRRVGHMGSNKPLLNDINNENKKIKETIFTPLNEPAFSKSNKPLVLNDMTIEVDRFSGAEGDPKSLMINATQMCKAAGKLFANYKQLDGTKDYLQALESIIGIPILELIKVDVGGNHSGTWIHRLVAVHLAQWLSPSFAVQVSLWVNELMITGKVEIGNELSNNQLDDKWRLKLMEENNRCKDLELTISRIEENKIQKEENEKKKIIDDLNTTISVFSTETKSNLNLHGEKEVIYLGYIGNFLFKYGQSSNFKDRLGTHEKSTSYEKFEIVKVFACKNPVVSEKRVREWVRKKRLEYEYKPEGETFRGQREIIKIESKEMLERVCKAMHKYSNLNINKMPEAEVEITKIEADKEVEIKKIEADKEVEIKKIEADKELEIKRMNLLADGKITFDQYIQLKK